jgi:beta-glucosidase-like glycosyl hydrolase
MIQYYDYPLDVYLNPTRELMANGTVPLSSLQSHVRKILAVKHDLRLFSDPYIPETVNSQDLKLKHAPLTLDAAQKTIILLENRNNILPLIQIIQKISKIALIGPFSDTLNYVRLPPNPSRLISKGRLLRQIWCHPNLLVNHNPAIHA